MMGGYAPQNLIRDLRDNGVAELEVLECRLPARFKHILSGELAPSGTDSSHSSSSPAARAKTLGASSPAAHSAVMTTTPLSFA